MRLVRTHARTCRRRPSPNAAAACTNAGVTIGPPAILQPPADAPADTTWPEDPLHAWLLKERKIEVPVYAWPHTAADDAPRRRLLRISAELYNDISQYERLAQVLSSLR